MDIDKRRAPGGGKLTGSSRKSKYDYQRISRRHMRPPRSVPLRSLILWMVLGATTLVAFMRSPRTPPPAVPPPIPMVSEALGVDPPEPMQSPADPSIPAERTDPSPLPATVTSHLSAEAPVTAESPKRDTTVKVTLERDQAGNYVGMGMINEKSVRLLVDTGASMVIVPEPIATRIGLKKGKPMMFRTGGGAITHYATELDSLSIGPIQISHVPAAINPQMQEDFALLGMSALALLRFSQEGDNLVLSHDPGVSGEPGTENPEPIRFRRSVKECMGAGRTVDQRTLACISGN